MNILVVSHVPYMGGAEIVLADLILNDDQNSYCVLLPQGAFSRFLETNGVSIITNDSVKPLNRASNPIRSVYALLRNLFSGMFGIIKSYKRTKSEILYANSLRTGVYCIFPAILLGAPLLWHVHDFSESILWRVLFRITTLLHKNTKYVVVSEAVATSGAMAEVPTRFKKVVYNGIDLSHIQIKEAADMEKDFNLVTILMYGRIVAWKGYHVLLEALSLISGQANHQIRCLIAGDTSEDPTYVRSLNDFIASHDLDVEFIGFVEREDVYSLLSHVDLVVHASTRPDPLPTVVLESMAMGKHVIAVESGGVPEMIEDQKTGQLFTPNDAQSLAQTIERALEQTEDIGSMAKEKIQRHFTIERKVLNMNRVYGELKNS